MALKRGLVGLRHPHAAAVPRWPPSGEPGLPLLEEGGARLTRSARRRRRELRRLLLSAGASPRTQRHHPGRRPHGVPGQERNRPRERDRPDLPELHRLLRPALRSASLEPAGHHPQLLDRPGREHPDPHQHDAVLRGTRWKRERRITLSRSSRGRQAARAGLERRPARWPAASVDRGGGARHRSGAVVMPTWPSRERPAPRRTRTARTTAGSSGSRRPTSRS